MEQAALILATIAAGTSVVAILLATGAAIRVSRLEGRSQPHEGLEAGSLVPPEAMARLLEADEQAEWLAGPSVIAFVSPSCEPCRELTTRLNAVRERLPARVLFIEPELDGQESLATLAEFEARWVTDGNNSLRELFKSYATPHVFIIRDDRILDQRLGADADRLFGEDARIGPEHTNPHPGEAATIG